MGCELYDVNTVHCARYASLIPVQGVTFIKLEKIGQGNEHMYVTWLTTLHSSFRFTILTSLHLVVNILARHWAPV